MVRSAVSFNELRGLGHFFGHEFCDRIFLRWVASIWLASGRNADYKLGLDRENAISKRYSPTSTKIKTGLILVLLNQFPKFQDGKYF